MNTRTTSAINPQQFLVVAAMLIGLFLLARPAPHFDVRSISVLEASQLIASGAIVVDVREHEPYRGRHIPGAVSAPLSSLRKAIPAEIAQAKTRPVVVYCGDGLAIGPEGTSILNKAGFANAVNLEGGIQAWAGAGYAVETHG